MRSSDLNADLILSRFPGAVTLYPSRRKWLLVLLGCALFTAVGIVMVSQAAGGGWFVAIFFAVGAIVAAFMLLPGAGALALDADGFQATSLFRRRRTRWQDVTGFEAVQIPPSMQKMIVFDDSKMTGRTIAKLNAAIAGHNAGLPDTYGLLGDDLARLMTQWRQRAVAHPSEGVTPPAP
jgi:hypothetical protein